MSSKNSVEEKKLHMTNVDDATISLIIIKNNNNKRNRNENYEKLKDA